MERIQHLNTEFRTEVKKERYRLNLSLSSRLRASNQNLYEVFQIRPIKQTLLFGIKKRGWCYIVEDTCKAGAFRIHLVQYVSKSQTGTTHGNCSGSYVTYFQGDEVERAGVRCNKETPSRILIKPKYLLNLKFLSSSTGFSSSSDPRSSPSHQQYLQRLLLPTDV